MHVSHSFGVLHAKIKSQDQALKALNACLRISSKYWHCGVLGCVSNVHQVHLSPVSVILFSGHGCEICLQALSNASMTLSLPHLKEIINLKS